MKVKECGASSVVTLLTGEELDILQLKHMGLAVEAQGMSWIYWNLRDKWIPWDARSPTAAAAFGFSGNSGFLFGF